MLKYHQFEMEWEDLRLFDNTKSIFLQGRLSYERDETENKVLIQTDKVLLINNPSTVRILTQVTSSLPTEQSLKQSREVCSKQEKSNEKGNPGHPEEKQISEWSWE